ncbi:Hypothetical protein FKW44_024227 [Caligus rogercresseyi]|uniref:Uncharacterized protein n=1 Tax=Caligus rogercresseyi TaxID=217165 RepID=A0A7T8JT69_CALRO|nr:Hypothetical protein FKW44_024716 [Caligus rogercresseyi]QQP33009.1 Hypothetical protein FKW44_024227 [Caligus rogercresseyi]
MLMGPDFVRSRSCFTQSFRRIFTSDPRGIGPSPHPPRSYQILLPPPAWKITAELMSQRSMQHLSK